MRRAPLVVLALLLALFAGREILRPPTARASNAAGAVRTSALAAALREGPDRTHDVWVYLRDKGSDPSARLGEATLSPRALARRSLRGTTRGATVADVPLVRGYVEAVAGRVTRVRQQVR